MVHESFQKHFSVYLQQNRNENIPWTYWQITLRIFGRSGNDEMSRHHGDALWTFECIHFISFHQRIALNVALEHICKSILKLPFEKAFWNEATWTHWLMNGSSLMSAGSRLCDKWNLLSQMSFCWRPSVIFWRFRSAFHKQYCWWCVSIQRLESETLIGSIPRR